MYCGAYSGGDGPEGVLFGKTQSDHDENCMSLCVNFLSYVCVFIIKLCVIVCQFFVLCVCVCVFSLSITLFLFLSLICFMMARVVVL